MRATGLVWGGTLGLAGCGDGERDGNGREDVVGAAVEEVEGGPESIDAVEEEIAAFAGEVRSPERFALECRAARALFAEGRSLEGSVRYLAACEEHGARGSDRYDPEESRQVLRAALRAGADPDHVGAVATLAAEMHPKWGREFRAVAERAKDPRWAWSWRKVAPAGKAPKLEAEAERWKDFPDAWLFPDERPVIWKELPDKE